MKVDVYSEIKSGFEREPAAVTAGGASCWRASVKDVESGCFRKGFDSGGLVLASDL